MKKIYSSLIVLFFVAALHAQIAPVVISEVFYDTPLNENLFTDTILSPYFNGEYIELFNPTTEKVNLEGWRLKDGDSWRDYTFPEGSEIPARSTILVVYRHPKSPNFSIRDLFSNITAAQEQAYVFYHSTIRLTNDGDMLYLYNNKGQKVDEMSWKTGKSKNSRMDYNWDIKARNGGGFRKWLKMLSIQRKDIHASTSSIDALKEDYEVREATPLSIPADYDLLVLETLYRGEEINTALPVGTLAGNAGVSHTGAATYEIPLVVPPGTNDHQPQLSVAYNSQGGFGILGQGWDISGLSVISRGIPNFYYDGSILNSTTLQFNSKDCLYLDGQRLILVEGTHFENNAVYAFETENYARVKLIKKASENSSDGRSRPNKNYDSDISFILTFPDGREMEYGNGQACRVHNITYSKDSDDRALAWKLNKSTDVYGNSIEYTYTENGRYISQINYTGTQNRVEFNYENNTKNSKKQYIKGFVVQQEKLLNSIDVYSANNKIRTYKFEYTTSNMDKRLQSVSEYIANRQLNSTKIGWGEDSFLRQIYVDKYTAGDLIQSDDAYLYTGDIDGDGHPDRIEMRAKSYSGREERRDAYFCVKFKGGKESNTISVKEHRDYPFFVPGIVTGDINGDGKDEIILIENQQVRIFGYDKNTELLIETGTHSYNLRASSLWRTNKNYGYNAFLANVNNDEYPDLVIVPYCFRNTEDMISYYDCEVFPGSATGLSGVSTSYPLSLSDKKGVWHAPMMGDFNADGKPDFLHISNDYSKSHTNDIFDIYESTSWNNLLFKDNKAGANRFTRIYPIDYNNDGLTDLLIQRTKEDNRRWYFLKNNGGALVVPTEERVSIHTGYDNRKGEISDVFILDYNGDGLPDIIFADEINEKDNVFKEHRWYIYKNLGGSYVQDGNFITSDKRIMKMRPVVADINNDGIADLVFTDGESYRALSMPNAGKRALVHQITDGMGQVHKFSYKNYSDYNQGATTDPVRNLKSPLMVVESHTHPAGHKTTYTYANGKVHKHKGFLGFLNVTAENNTTKVKTTATYQIDNKYYTLQPVKQETFIEGELVSTTQQEYEVVTIDAEKKRFISLIKNEYVIDHLKNIAQFTNYAYYGDNNLGRVTVRVNAGERASVTTYSDYKQRNGTGISYLPGTVSTVSQRKGQANIQAEVKYEYNDKGQVVKKTEYPGKNAEIVYTYQYYPSGNTQWAMVTPKDCPPQKTTWIYKDNYYRFPSGVVNTLGQTSYTEYDYATGNILSETGTDGLKTTYQYDNRGRLVKTIYPNSEEVNYSLNWSTDHGARYKKQISNTRVKNTSTTWYDYQGRVVYTEQTGANGDILTSRNEYNKKG